MKLTKASQAYIKDFAEKAAKIFQAYAFYYDGLPGAPAYIPDAEKLEQTITQKVLDFNSKLRSITSGRIMITHWDAEPYFKLWIDLKEMSPSIEEINGLLNSESFSQRFESSFSSNQTGDKQP